MDSPQRRLSPVAFVSGPNGNLRRHRVVLRPFIDIVRPIGPIGLIRQMPFIKLPKASLQPAQFVDRPNRFLIRCRLGKRIIQAFLPNPGRLWELLLPGVTVYIVKEPFSSTRKNAFTALAVEREGVPILLHTHRTNEVAGSLIDHGKGPRPGRGPGNRPGDPHRPLPLRSVGGA